MPIPHGAWGTCHSGPGPTCGTSPHMRCGRLPDGGRGLQGKASERQEGTQGHEPKREVLIGKVYFLLTTEKEGRANNLGPRTVKVVAGLGRPSTLALPQGPQPELCPGTTSWWGWLGQRSVLPAPPEQEVPHALYRDLGIQGQPLQLDPVGDSFLAFLSSPGRGFCLARSSSTQSLAPGPPKPVCQGVDSCLWGSEGRCDISFSPTSIISVSLKVHH